jgi:AcrR family transcriptional regulator
MRDCLLKALMRTRKSTLRVRGLARRDELLESARQLLATRDMSELSLGDVAKHAKVPKGSAYHFYANILEVYAGLVAVHDKALHLTIAEPIQVPVKTWSDVVEILLDRAVEFYMRNPSARQLLIGPKTPPELKMRDRQNDVLIGKVFEEHVARLFTMPSLPGRSDIFFRAVEIADLMLCLSMLGHQEITGDMADEAKRGAVAYLASYMPLQLPRKRLPPSRQRASRPKRR